MHAFYTRRGQPGGRAGVPWRRRTRGVAREEQFRKIKLTNLCSRTPFSAKSKVAHI